MIIDFHLFQIKNIAAQLWRQYNQSKIWAFNAPMGAGKTTLISSLCQVLEVCGPISSPTFAIINEYKSNIGGTIYHMDWYRLKDEAEVIHAGCEDCIESGNLCLIEWADKAPHFLSGNTVQVNIEIINNLERRLKVNLQNT